VLRGEALDEDVGNVLPLGAVVPNAIGHEPTEMALSRSFLRSLPAALRYQTELATNLASL
jgi:hypothetical protein